MVRSPHLTFLAIAQNPAHVSQHAKKHKIYGQKIYINQYVCSQYLQYLQF